MIGSHMRVINRLWGDLLIQHLVSFSDVLQVESLHSERNCNQLSQTRHLTAA